jgi:hypothetical protein
VYEVLPNRLVPLFFGRTISSVKGLRAKESYSKWYVSIIFKKKKKGLAVGILLNYFLNKEGGSPLPIHEILMR